MLLVLRIHSALSKAFPVLGVLVQPNTRHCAELVRGKDLVSPLKISEFKKIYFRIQILLFGSPFSLKHNVAALEYKEHFCVYHPLPLVVQIWSAKVFQVTLEPFTTVISKHYATYYIHTLFCFSRSY